MLVEVKPIPPAEPAEPVLCGSLAIGGTSLAVAKAGATILHIPLYLHTALLKHNQVLMAFPLFCPTYHNYCSLIIIIAMLLYVPHTVRP